MALSGLLVPRRKTVTLAVGSDLTPLIDVSRFANGTYFTPSTWTNTGATNLNYFNVSNNYGDAVIMPNAVTVTGVSAATPGVVTATAHGLVSGQIISISGITGMSGTSNGQFLVKYIDADSFSLYTFTTGQAAATSGTFGGTAVVQVLGNIGLLTVAGNTFKTHRHTASTFYFIPREVFNFRWFQINTHIVQASAPGVVPMVFNEGYFTWKREIVEIASSGQNSGGLALRGAVGGSYQLPAVMTGTAITYGVSDDGGNWTTLKDTADSSVSQTVAVPTTGEFLSGLYAIPDAALSFRYIRLQSGSAEGAKRQITFDLKYSA